jgi:hypothetical protein
MSYLLEEINLLNQQKIMADAKLKNLDGMLSMRGGHFENNPHLKWAVDYENDSYLFSAPSMGERSYFYYLFYIGGEFFILRVKCPAGLEVEFFRPKLQSNFISSEMENSIVSAFSAYGHFGDAWNDGFSTNFFVSKEGI